MLTRMVEDTRRGKALSRVSEVQSEIDRMEGERDLAVARSVYWGATWSEIAEALGVTTQSAHRRFRWLRYDPVTRRTWTEDPSDG
jgi:hypothetical protein